jgi:hypothetical protein
MDTEQQRLDMVIHIVNDYTNLVSAGMLLKQAHPPPVNTHVQYAFLVECRKFANFFADQRGKNEAIAKDYVARRLGASLPTWKAWHKHMNVHLMHLSYDRLTSTTQWTGHTINRQLLDEFMKAWKLFLSKLHEPFATEFEKRISARSKKPEYKGFDFH